MSKSKRHSKLPAKLEHDEAAFLAAYDPRAFAPLAVTVDVALVSAFDGRLHTWLIKRHEHPNKSKWALPGSFVAPAVSLERTAQRVLRDKVGLTGVFVEQLFSFGAPRRDPRMRVVTVAYMALVDHARFASIEGPASNDNKDRKNKRNGHTAELLVEWEGETGGPVIAMDGGAKPLKLAFDHADILGMAVKRLRGKLNYSPIGFQLLPDAFTLRQLQHIHEVVQGHAVNKDSFRRRMLASGQLEATGEKQADVGHRPAELYRFTRRSAI